MSRKCPYCGEEVPSFSLNCPKCFRSIPREKERGRKDSEEYRINEDRTLSLYRFDRKTVLILALIPAAFGLMGLGQIYEREYKKGTAFLVTGLVLFVSLVSLASNFGSYGHGTFLAVGGTIFVLLLYIAVYSVQAFDALVRSIIPISVG